MRKLVLVLLISACSTGYLGEPCDPDGTCRSPALFCSSSGFCYAKQAQYTSDADRFCADCLTRCGSVGLKRCEYTDPTVWGSKPTVCECRQ